MHNPPLLKAMEGECYKMFLIVRIDGPFCISYFPMILYIVTIAKFIINKISIINYT